MTARIRLLARLMMVLACLAMAGAASAQFGRGVLDNDELFRPQFGARDLAVMTGLLKLDAGQRDLVNSILDDYQRAYRTEAERIQDEIDEIRRQIEQSGDRRNWRQMMQPLSDKRDEMTRIRERLAKSFVSDVKAFLAPEQVELWPKYERQMRRQLLLPRAYIAGEHVDLFTIVEATLDEAERLAVEPILEEYALRLDEALIRREEEMSDIEDRVRDFMRNMDFSAALRFVERQRKLREAIRDVHDRYARLIELELADPTDFREEFRRRAYPRVWEPTWTEQYVRAALQLEGLDPATAESLRALLDRYTVRLRAINESLERTMREHDARSMERRIEMIQARTRGQEVDWQNDPVRIAFAERAEFENSIVQQVDALLPEEHRALLPQRIERPDDDDDGWGRRGRGRIGASPRQFDGLRPRRSDDAPVDEREDLPPPVDERGFPRGLGGGG